MKFNENFMKIWETEKILERFIKNTGKFFRAYL